MKFVFFFLFLIILTVFLFSCSSSRKGRGTDNVNPDKQPVKERTAFVETYSKKLGVTVPESASRQLITGVGEWMGTPYKYGGIEKTGVDCSGLIYRLYHQVYGIKVPRQTTQLRQKADPVKRNALAEGDLVFFKIDSKEVGHAGIYLFGSYFVHASTSRGVIISRFDDPYWSKFFEGGGRLLNQKK